MRFDIDHFCRTLALEAADAVIYADGTGMIAFWNKGAGRIFGYSEAEALGRSLDIIIPERLRRRHWEGYDRTMRTGRTRYGAGEVLAVPALRKGGLRISVEFTILPFHDDAGRMVGIDAILRAVTNRFAETQALRNKCAEPARKSVG